MVGTDGVLGRVLRKERAGARDTDAGCLNVGRQPMNDNATSGKEASGINRQPAHRNELAVAASEKTLKRSRWEHLRLAACPGVGRVNVCNFLRRQSRTLRRAHVHRDRRARRTSGVAPCYTDSGGVVKSTRDSWANAE